VWALRAAGAIILGKTVTTEFACGNSGPTRNPYDSTRTPGGSSSGSAASVGAGMTALGLGTQTHASTIRPASYCGAYALKATHGALHTGGVTALAPTLDHLGVFGASLEDLWAGAMAIASRVGGTPPHPGLRGALTAPPPRKPGMLIRLSMRGWEETPALSQAAFEAALSRLSHSSVRILDRANDPSVEALERELADLHEYSLDLLAWETRWPLSAYRAHGDDQVGERIHDLLDRAASMNEERYEHAVKRRRDLRAMVYAFAGKADGFVALASSGPAIQDHAFTGSRSYALPWTLVGGPAFALPVLSADELPLGLQLAGFANHDERLCASAGWIRDALLN
jgi:Asp-tRNA(Asn)/Glu-tRNA(Gln) amidotransferase A subunit family amidase